MFLQACINTAYLWQSGFGKSKKRKKENKQNIYNHNLINLHLLMQVCEGSKCKLMFRPAISTEFNSANRFMFRNTEILTLTWLIWFMWLLFLLSRTVKEEKCSRQFSLKQKSVLMTYHSIQHLTKKSQCEVCSVIYEMFWWLVAVY